jgi:hypothetical protein
LVLAAEGSLVAILKRDGLIWREVYSQVFTALWQQRHLLMSQRRARQSARQITLTQYLRPFSLLPRKLIMLMRFGIPDIQR